MPSPTPSTLRQMPAGIWVLGLVSLLMDISSEMVHSLLPLFMVSTLGASVLAVGLIEGLACRRIEAPVTLRRPRDAGRVMVIRARTAAAIRNAGGTGPG
jgi:hypothetical protein